MKASEIKVGGHYLAKVSGKVVTVRVDRISQNALTSRDRLTTTYYVTNLATGRQTTFRSVAKFRSAVNPAEAGRSTIPFGQEKRPTMTDSSTPTNGSSSSFTCEAEGKQCSDPNPACGEQKQGPSSSTDTSNGSSPMAQRLRQAIEHAQQPEGSGPPHVIVQARAGTGKTTTLIEGLKLLKGIGSKLTPSPQQQAVWDAICQSKGAKTICFVAFNKSISTELQQRVPAGVDAMTMHSMGFRAVTKAFGRQEPNSWIVQDHIAAIMERDLRELKRTKPVVLQATEELVSLCKMNLVGPPAADNSDLEGKDGTLSRLWWEDQLDRLASYYEVDLNGSRSEVFDLVPKVLERCKKPKGKITFDDMIYLPVALDLPVFRYDLLLVDEAQDLNRCQQALAKKAGRRLVLVGDDRQAIYGFAGADSDSLPRLDRELNDTERGCIKIPLTVTRRCGKAIVEEARKIVPDFEAHESNPEGKISYAKF